MTFASRLGVFGACTLFVAGLSTRYQVETGNYVDPWISPTWVLLATWVAIVVSWGFRRISPSDLVRRVLPTPVREDVVAELAALRCFSPASAVRRSIAKSAFQGYGSFTFAVAGLAPLSLHAIWLTVGYAVTRDDSVHTWVASFDSWVGLSARCTLVSHIVLAYRLWMFAEAHRRGQTPNRVLATIALAALSAGVGAIPCALFYKHGSLIFILPVCVALVSCVTSAMFLPWICRRLARRIQQDRATTATRGCAMSRAFAD
jgi:hypothetical protein